MGSPNSEYYWLIIFPIQKMPRIPGIRSIFRSNTHFLGRHRKIILWFLDTFEQFFHNSSSVSRLCSPGLELMPLGTPFDVDLSNKATKKTRRIPARPFFLGHDLGVPSQVRCWCLLFGGFNLSENISQLGLPFLIYGTIKFMFQTTNQSRSFFSSIASIFLGNIAQSQHKRKKKHACAQITF